MERIPTCRDCDASTPGGESVNTCSGDAADRIVIVPQTDRPSDMLASPCIADWTTFDDYLAEHQLDEHPLQRSDPRLGTRSRHCVVEVLFRFPTTPSCEREDASICQLEGDVSHMILDSSSTLLH